MIMMVPEIQLILRLQPSPSRYLSLKLLRPLSSICRVESHHNHGSMQRIVVVPKKQVGHSMEIKRSFWETFPSLNPRYVYEKDGIDRENHELVFRSGSFNYVFYTQFIAMNVFAIQMYYTAFMVYSFWLAQPFNLPDMYGPFPIEYNLFSYLVLSVFTVQNAFMFMLARRAIHRIYYNHKNNEYVLIHPAVNPFRTCQIFCRPGELKEIPKPLASFMLGRYKVRNRRIAINSNRFRTMEHLNRLLGYID